MNKIYILNYCSPGCEPLKSITQLNESNAYDFANVLSANNGGTAFHRFADFNNYYPKRIRTEKWLYDCFVTSGGKPTIVHPYYFVLHGSEYLNKWFGEGIITKLLLNDINSKDISFTFGDSMARMDNPERKDPIMKEKLLELIEKYDNDIELFISNTCKGFNYIEVQLWNDIYLKDCIL